MCVIQSGHCGGWSWKYLEHQAGQKNKWAKQLVKVGGFELFCERKMAMEKPSNYIPSGQNRWFADTKWLVLKGPKFNQYVGTLLLTVLQYFSTTVTVVFNWQERHLFEQLQRWFAWTTGGAKLGDVVMFFVGSWTGSQLEDCNIHTAISSCGELYVFFSCVFLHPPRSPHPLITISYNIISYIPSFKPVFVPTKALPFKQSGLFTWGCDELSQQLGDLCWKIGWWHSMHQGGEWISDWGVFMLGESSFFFSLKMGWLKPVEIYSALFFWFCILHFFWNSIDKIHGLLWPSFRS